MTIKESDVSEGVASCPFCGSDEVSLSYCTNVDNVVSGRFVECEDCCACGPVHSPQSLGFVAAWNTRATLSPPLPSPPIPMLLYCPKCGLKHVDEPEEVLAWTGGAVPEPSHSEVVWENPPHRSHLCHGCGTIWRPADVPTNGVERIESAGKADTLDLNDVATLSPLPSPGVERLREALEPFARVHDNPDRPDDETVMVLRSLREDEHHKRQGTGRSPLGEGAREIHSLDGLTLGDFRRARAALYALPLDGGGCASPPLSLTPSGIGEEGAARA